MMTKFGRLPFYFAICFFVTANVAHAASGLEVQRRIDADLTNGKPIVVHVVVVLCDNESQNIVPVPAELGNGRNPKTNLYWGAAYGFRSHLLRRGGFKMIAEHNATGSGILQKIVLYKSIKRTGALRRVFVVGEAWDGRKMKGAIHQYLSFAAGRNKQTETVKIDGKNMKLAAGGSAALVVFIGHNGLMDFALGTEPDPGVNAPPRSTVVLACASKPYFLKTLRRIGSHPLLLTTGLMAPEAYTLDAVIHGFVRGASAVQTRDEAAAAYHYYQKCGLSAAKRLFFYDQ